MTILKLNPWQPFIDFDRLLTLFFINAPHPWIVNSIFSFFSAKGVYIVIWFGIFLYLIFFEKKRSKIFIIYFFASIIIAFLSVFIIKNITKQHRPFATNFQRVPTDYPTDYSFPSGHATISFAAAVILSAFDQKRKRYFYIIASLIAFSRVYLGYHYVFDVIIGSLLGWLISYSLLVKLKRKNAKIKTTLL